MALGICNSFKNLVVYKCVWWCLSSCLQLFLEFYMLKGRCAQFVLLITSGRGEYIEKGPSQCNTILLVQNKVQLYLIPFALEWMQFDAEWAGWCWLHLLLLLSELHWEYKSPEVITNRTWEDSLSYYMAAWLEYLTSFVVKSFNEFNNIWMLKRLLIKAVKF